MAFEPIKYQSLSWRTTLEEDVDCGNCATGEVYIDWTLPNTQAVRLLPYYDLNLLDYTYDADNLPVPDVKTPTTVRMTEDSGVYCYSRVSGDPYWCSYTLPLTRRNPAGDIDITDYMKVEFTYTSNVVMYATIHIQGPLGQSASTPVYVELPVNLTGATVVKYLEVTAVYASYQLVLKYNASTTDSDAFFCVEDISLMQMTVMVNSSLRITDCTGFFESVAVDGIEYYDDVMVFSMELYEGHELSYFSFQGGLNTDDVPEGNPSMYSNWVQHINPDTYGECKINALLKVEWTYPCMYVSGGVQQSIDYTFYLKGYVQRVSRELRERVFYIDSAGIGKNIFDNSVSKAEIVVNYPYRYWLHEILEGITSLNDLFVNDQQYRPDATNFWTIVGNGNGTYSGRTEMCVGDSERIYSVCCCPVATPDYSGCGDLTITDICTVATVRAIRYELSGAVNATSIDVQFENVTAIEESPCDVAINTTHTESAVTTIGFNAVSFTAADWQQVFDDNYCGVTDIEYYIRIRTNCGDSNLGEWSDPFTIVPDALDICS